jgi:hypothetical protein
LANRLIISSSRNQQLSANSSQVNYSFEESRRAQDEAEEEQRRKEEIGRSVVRTLDPMEEFLDEQLAVLTRSGLQVRLIPELETHLEQLASLKELAHRLTSTPLLGEMAHFYRLRIFTLQSAILDNIVSIISARVREAAAVRERLKRMVSAEELERLAPVEMGRTGMEECPICVAEVVRFQEVRRLPCNHHFHKDCIDAWIFKNPNCPKCRVALKP